MKYGLALPARLLSVACPLAMLLIANSAQAQEPDFSQAPKVEESRLVGDEEAAATMRDAFVLPPGFQVELLFTVPRDQVGSWVCLALDDKGRILASDQGGGGLCRITPGTPGTDEETKVEKLDLGISAAQGLLYAFDSLYISVNDGGNSGLYRARDTNGDDQYDELVKIVAMNGGGEHGPHSLRLSPDGESIYIIAGNHTNLPEIVDESLIPQNWGEDLLLPRQWDANGHATGILAPGGWICRLDPDGENWEVVSMGYRNPYDMAFNADGELFAYDADMEWDLGSPWYRPTRVVHAASGSEFGWRSGTGKWPTNYPDSLPPAVDIGPGSPVGATFGYDAAFPAKYQNAFFILDWTFGTMYAIHFEPEGASYTATKEEFVARNGLPLTDVVIGEDGAMYFAVGGRGAQSSLYRVTYVGDESTEPVDHSQAEGAELRELRHSLEAFHNKQDEAAVPAALEQLGNEDRFIRYAARIALEFQPTESWREQVLALEDPQALITGGIALARQGAAEDQAALLEALGSIDYTSLDEATQLELLRAYELAFIRLGEPDVATKAELVKKFDPLFPAESDAINRELVQILVYLDSPTVYGKTLELMETPYDIDPQAGTELLQRNPGYGDWIANMLANTPEIQKIWYAYTLRNVKYGCTIEERKRYFDWLNNAYQHSGGNSYRGFLDHIRDEAVANTPEADRPLVTGNLEDVAPIDGDAYEAPKGPGREYTLEEVLAMAEGGLQGRDYEHGQAMFASARCIVCHRFNGQGGATGPDLSNVAARFPLKDLLEAVMQPGKVVSDQYEVVNVYTVGGLTVQGRIIDRNDESITIMTDPEDHTKTEVVLLADLDGDIEKSDTSLMPDGLLTPLNEDELLDLLAYLMSRGNANDVMFTTAAEGSEEDSPTATSPLSNNTSGGLGEAASTASRYVPWMLLMLTLALAVATTGGWMAAKRARVIRH